nr:MAG TPA: hypothetical protein [Caudoviricetes sp.]
MGLCSFNHCSRINSICFPAERLFFLASARIASSNSVGTRKVKRLSVSLVYGSLFCIINLLFDVILT